jgi:hypothetical protein
MDSEFLATLLGSVPAYTEATFTVAGGRTVVGMARDLPRLGRRWTVNGWEWFLDADTLTRLGVTHVAFEPFDVNVNQ